MRISFVVCFFLMFFSVLAQKKKDVLYFAETIFDFGTLSEDDAPPTHIFTFKNRGDFPVSILEVRSSCFCATPDFPCRPVLPGQTGEIKITFKPKGHPGKFNKRIRVVMKEQPEGLDLRIKGMVIPGKPDRYPSYPYRFGDLRLKNVICRFRQMCPGKRREERIAVVNEGRQSLSLSFQYLPSHLHCYLEPQVLKPGEEGDIVIVAMPLKEWKGEERSDRIQLNLTGNSSVFYMTVKMGIGENGL